MKVISDNALVMNSTEKVASFKHDTSVESIRTDRKEKLAGAFRLFGKYGFDEGVAGHITVRDPKYLDHFWVNPLGKSFNQIQVSDLLLVNHQGKVVEGEGLLNGAAFTIHAHIHQARKDVIAAAHAHSTYGKAFSCLGRELLPTTQDACAFFNDHSLLKQFGGVVLDKSEGELIVQALGRNKAIILQNHGLLTVGRSVESACWWYIAMERACQTQLLVEAIGKPKLIPDHVAKETHKHIGRERTGWFNFLSLYEHIVKEQADLLR
ncbi:MULTISPECIES: class II aldolase/adducin family protein [Pseudoalteromonas]|uniref:class II aldolase/adducin family protein n=1 Tax=Pseudoalteromonas TaxID=53246 RepID=UPI000299D76C|nr:MULTISPECIES: class II aldolase/adducin family protein [Pseudoalteromonas]MBR8845633.1 class II aldolase/adducin family protein [Pseudoalteromonas sp. JC3]QUI72627.1 class II aldolase/adducin family protein [Pseudoalteromonas sp. M8]UDM60025.1 class II aldolase/adducin family protein [Pseudoalteromonas piscicida]WJE08842.1 class II aldolase/adducin family protein [Pseudoalteromonas sp. JC3]